MITVQTCSTLPEAQVIQSLLEGSGIKAFLPDEMTVQNNWLWANAIGGVRVQVREEDAERAAEILDDGGLPETETACPRCGTTLREANGFDVYPKALVALLFSLPFRSKAKLKCPACGMVCEKKLR